ncbi:MAG: hypothetical protein ACTSRP_02765 [Candidatus Helarchaeota archaeon]
MLKHDTSSDALLKNKIYCKIIRIIETIYKEFQNSDSKYTRVIIRILLEIGIYINGLHYIAADLLLKVLFGS